MVKVSLAILIIPLISFLVNGLFVYGKNRLSSYLSIALMLLTIVCSAVILYSVGSEVFTSEIDWFVVGGQTFSIGLLIDFSGAVMLAVISIVSFLVHLYSLLYMAKDSGYTRYFAFLGLFTFAINGIVLADNLLVVFVFWELVGLSSYLLIGHWYQKDSASKAAKKAFIINRIGDAGFIAALCILWSQFGTFHLLELETLMSNSVIKDGLWVSDIGSLPEVWLTVLGVGLFMAAMGKSAQFPLQVWLPDAMEGPTPVSALIHAATMVAAGVFLMSRVFVLLDMDSLLFVAIVGSLTAFMGAVAALAQNDIKKVLAFSTISQLGYMIMGVGVGAYDAALFHLFTHAFFKAALFLAAGSVIYSLHELAHEKGLHFDAQDMRNMGEIKKALPVTFYTYFMAACALVGVPLFSGFLSKDALLVATINWSNE
ncbi:MAG: NADH-quinone oxidoreductase subunit L, partial [Bacteroidota bacterium]